MDNNIYTQIGIVLIIALASKNAILIVEFARELRAEGESHPGRGGEGVAAAVPADPDDLFRLHSRDRAAGLRRRGRRREPAGLWGRPSSAGCSPPRSWRSSSCRSSSSWSSGSPSPSGVPDRPPRRFTRPRGPASSPTRSRNSRPSPPGTWSRPDLTEEVMADGTMTDGRSDSRAPRPSVIVPSAMREPVPSSRTSASGSTGRHPRSAIALIDAGRRVLPPPSSPGRPRRRESLEGEGRRPFAGFQRLAGALQVEVARPPPGPSPHPRTARRRRPRAGPISRDRCRSARNR